jgi:hypothetical protein
MNIKTVNRVHRNGATKPVLNQDPAIGFAATTMRRGKAVTIPLMTELGLTCEEWQAACLKNHEGQKAGKGNFFAEAIREKLRQGPDVRRAADRMQQEANLAVALLKLIDNYVRENPNSLDSEMDDNFKDGLGGLIHLTTDTLSEAAEEVGYAAYPKGEQTA